MAAYGALVSVMQIMDQLHRHPHPPISLDEKQSESLAANVTFLQEFLEGYNPHVSYTAEADPLESRIAEAAYAAEDVIESYIVDQINLARSTDYVEDIRCIKFSQGLDRNYSFETDSLDNLIAADQILDQILEGYHPHVDQIHARSSDHVEEISSTQFYEDVIESDAGSIDHAEEINPAESLEGYNPHVSYSAEADPLESRIAEAAYAAEDVIESDIVDQIHSRSSDQAEDISPIDHDLFLSNSSDEISVVESLEAFIPHRYYSSEAVPLDNLIAADQILDPPTNDGEKISCIEFFQCVPTLMSYIAHTIQQLLEGYHHPHIDQIHARSSDHVEEISSTQLYQDLQKVIEEMDQITMEIKEKNMKEKKLGVQIIKKQSTTDAASSRSSTAHAQKVTTMVGFDDVLSVMLEKLTRGGVDRQIIPIVGMGGLGKTTLARNVYEHPLIKERFHVCAWSTISQVHNTQEILRKILVQIDKQGMMGDLNENELGDKLYRYLLGRRYLIVMDDIWSIEAWDSVRHYFPNNLHGSRIVITTRLSNLASQFNDSNNSLDMKFLDEASSWDLFSKIVFGEESCPLELEKIGKKIVEGCRGLPLSIVVAGGLLLKSKSTQENWKLIEKNLSSFVNTQDDGSCLQILYTSYNNLPVYIKPCFLHLGLSKEDDKIPVNIQISLWVAEGFIRPRDGKSLEEVAEEYLEELIDRNLILVEGRDGCGDVKTFKVHDLVRDLALREAEKDRFLFFLMQRSTDNREISQGIISTHRRIASTVDEEYTLNKLRGSVEAPAALSLVRTLMGKIPQVTLLLPCFRLLRVLYMVGEEDYLYKEDIFLRLLNLRFILVNAYYNEPLWIPSYLWNLQTIYIGRIRSEDYSFFVIWKMPQLRLVMTKDPFRLSNPPLGGEEVVLENLHTLSEVRNLKLSEEVLKGIPNIIVLKLYYEVGEKEEEEIVDYCLTNLHRLNKLQDLHLNWYRWYSPPMLEFTLPYSLKQLSLRNTELPWEEMASKIGCLPLLQVLILKWQAFVGSEWETAEGQFSSLKFLQIDECDDLERWITDDSTHFPRLEHLVLGHLETLMAIPSSIGDILTLRSIKLSNCSNSAVASARRIVEEQKEQGNQDIQLQVIRKRI